MLSGTVQSMAPRQSMIAELSRAGCLGQVGSAAPICALLRVRQPIHHSANAHRGNMVMACALNQLPRPRHRPEKNDDSGLSGRKSKSESTMKNIR